MLHIDKAISHNECCLLKNILYLCDVFREQSCQALHIESVFVALIWKCGSFLKQKGTTNSTHSCYRQDEVYPFGYTCAPYLYECGVLHRLSDSRFCQNLFIDKRNDSTLEPIMIVYKPDTQVKCEILSANWYHNVPVIHNIQIQSRSFIGIIIV